MQLEPIAQVRSPYKQKFAIPRQPNLVREAVGELHFTPACADPNALRGLERFSHLWLIFGFHATADRGWSPTVTPPRLGGSERVGVFATRSMFRPNPLGLSVVEFAGIEQRGAALILRVRGIDLLDGTPVYDIKPYLPYADALPGAAGGFADSEPGSDIAVAFSPQARQALDSHAREYPELESFIVAVLRQDPRPAQHARRPRAREFAMLLHDLNIRWRLDAQRCEVLAIERSDETSFPSRPKSG